jgi:hypothetical protein
MCRPKSAWSSSKGEHEAPKGLEFGREMVEFDLVGVENSDTHRKAKANSGFNMRFSTAC